MEKICVKEIGKFKICYRKGSADEEVLKFSFANDIYFRGVPEYRPKPDHTIIDIGAHIGVFSILAASKVPNGRVFAIEASKDSLEYLKKNIEFNNVKNIQPVHLAVYDKFGTICLYHDSDAGNWANTVVKKLSDKFEECPSDSLEGFMKRYNIACCHFLKINCEGSEFKIILSTPGKILRKIKIFFILYHTDVANNYSINDLTRYLSKHGFYIRLRQWSEQRGWIIAIRASFLLRLGYMLRDGIYFIARRAYQGLKCSLRALSPSAYSFFKSFFRSMDIQNDRSDE